MTVCLIMGMYCLVLAASSAIVFFPILNWHEKRLKKDLDEILKIMMSASK